MAKKKSKRKAPTKAKIIEPLDTQFNCPFCNHEKVCEVKLQGSHPKHRLHRVPRLYGDLPDVHQLPFGAYRRLLRLDRRLRVREPIKPRGPTRTH
ncbi:Transcription elongation factor 1-like protein [Aphelenchoides fujianensis]|nr:Transcription elongation factor 1-like protein [Aphelenchoides fujianensis]